MYKRDKRKGVRPFQRTESILKQSVIRPVGSSGASNPDPESVYLSRCRVLRVSERKRRTPRHRPLQPCRWGMPPILWWIVVFKSSPILLSWLATNSTTSSSNRGSATPGALCWGEAWGERSLWGSRSGRGSLAVVSWSSLSGSVLALVGVSSGWALGGGEASLWGWRGGEPCLGWVSMLGSSWQGWWYAAWRGLLLPPGQVSGRWTSMRQLCCLPRPWWSTPLSVWGRAIPGAV